MRIAQLANFVSPTSGGMKVAIDQLGKGYLKDGHERLLIIPGSKDRVIEDDHGTTVTVKSPRVNSVYRMIFRPDKVAKILDKFRPDAVECSDKWTLTGCAKWARTNSASSVLLSHERLDDMLADWLGTRIGVKTAVRALNRRLARRFDTIVVTSDYSRGDFAGIDVDLRKVSLGVDLETFSPRYEQPEAPLKLCYAGRMSHEKHPHLAIGAAVELARRNVPFELHVFGKGPDLAKMQKLAEGAPVYFHGFLSGRQELAERYASSHIALSVCPTETFGLAVLESLACGTPVVTADRGGASELIDPNSGEKGEPSPEGIADAVERLAGRLSDDVRKAARRRAEEFSWEKSAKKMLEVHESLRTNS
ncbi:glycosyltransferase [Propionimicrobium lymphophilum]|uniref:glycosyltransferase n=1 Tax=Propionimicrobium lymphophilum TaxID=33012 RepID=UPI0004160284|nr:glycosyltransferase [Propionimicrobium lymphophilum]